MKWWPKKLKDKLEDVNDRYKIWKSKLLSLKYSHLNRSKDKLISRKQLLYKESFTCENSLQKKPVQVLFGLPIEKFNALFEPVSTYTDAIIYLDYNGYRKSTLNKPY